MATHIDWRAWALSAGLGLLGAPLASAQLQVFACEPEWAALAQELGGEEVDVYSATHPGMDPHHVQAKPSLVARLRAADLSVCTGAGLEVGWLPLVQRRARNARVLPGAPGHFEAAAEVDLLDRPARLDRADGDLHGEGNPHVLLDPRRLEQIARSLALRLQQLDPENAHRHRARWDAFQARWREAEARWSRQSTPLRGRRAIVHHQEWVYLFDWLGIERVAALEPKPGVPPSLQHLSALAELPVADWVVVSPLDDPKAAHWLSARTGAPVVVLPHTVGALDGADDLVLLFDVVVAALLQALR